MTLIQNSDIFGKKNFFLLLIKNIKNKNIIGFFDKTIQGCHNIYSFAYIGDSPYNVK